MPPERTDSTDPHDWLARARSSLKQARTKVEDVYLEDFCFCAQQAAEKAFKGVLIHLGHAHPYTHSISRLITRLQGTGVEVPTGIQRAARLTDYAVETRYPGTPECVEEDEWREAVSIAEAVVKWSAAIIEGDPVESKDGA